MRILAEKPAKMIDGNNTSFILIAMKLTGRLGEGPRLLSVRVFHPLQLRRYSMKRLSFVVPVFTLIALATMARPALAEPPGLSTPEPSTIVAFAGLGVMGLASFFWQWRKRRS